MTQRLQHHLELERDALTHQDMGQLTESAQQKQHCVMQLQAASQQRELWLQQQGITASREGVDGLLATLQDESLNITWRTLLTTIETCQQENRQLGMLIKRGQLATEQAQHILQRGTSSSNHAYNARGNSEHSAKSRQLAKA